MTRQKDRKRIIRNRMKKTGESYTAARAQVLSKPNSRQPAAPAVDYAALAGMSDDKVAAKTGRTWKQWADTLDRDDASAMPHRDIAQLVHTRHGVGDWWAQTVTVGYERIKGLRDRGQRRGGGYETTKSKTYNVPVATLFRAWSDDATRRRWIGSAKATVRKATPSKSVRLQWPDGTIIAVLFTPKGSKSAVAVTQTKLPTKAAADAAREEWAARLQALAQVVGGG
jgi:hypothetical protein